MIFHFQYKILSEQYKFYLWLRCENIIDNDRNWPNVQIVIKLGKKLSVIVCSAAPPSLAPLPTRQSCNIRFKTFIIEFAGEIIVREIVLQLTDILPDGPHKEFFILDFLSGIPVWRQNIQNILGLGKHQYSLSSLFDK